MGRYSFTVQEVKATGVLLLHPINFREEPSSHSRSNVFIFKKQGLSTNNAQVVYNSTQYYLLYLASTNKIS
jgi:hypothetical protein